MIVRLLGVVCLIAFACSFCSSSTKENNMTVTDEIFDIPVTTVPTTFVPAGEDEIFTIEDEMNKAVEGYIVEDIPEDGSFFVDGEEIPDDEIEYYFEDEVEDFDPFYESSNTDIYAGLLDDVDSEEEYD